MENLGRSAVERGRYILAQHLRIPGEGAYSSLNQFWASGIPSTNELLMDMSLENDEFPRGHTVIQIIDMERKFNLSAVRSEQLSTILQRAIESMGVDPAQVTDIVDSYLDWVDPDDNKRLHGAESDFYVSLNPAAPYVAKNGIMDDISEFLYVRGMTPEIFFGPSRASSMPRMGAPRSAPLGSGGAPTGGGSSVGLVDLFTTISAAGLAVNVNTASSEVLQLLPGMDATLAQSIVDTRSGPDHADGTEDDIPFLQRGELVNVPGMTPELMQAMSQFLVTQSSVFLIRVEANIGEYVRQYEALVQRRNAMDVTILYFRAI